MENSLLVLFGVVGTIIGFGLFLFLLYWLIKNKRWNYLALTASLCVVLPLMMWGISLYKPAGKDQEKIPYIALHTFSDTENTIFFPIAPDRWEGVQAPPDATAYTVGVIGDDSSWRQIRTWKGVDGPILKKRELSYMDIPRNKKISAATFWVRGEGYAVIVTERPGKKIAPKSWPKIE
ncbi:hypothetical protein JW698_01190 [Candidatus Wolfebacteria bacterium]|nr:hypothetical protein [Candidatus Wolfebacteria bacterium]